MSQIATSKTTEPKTALSPMSYRTSPAPLTTMPPGIPFIIGNELAERFSFYGMRTILMTFMTHALVNHEGMKDVMSEPEAAKWMHTYMAAVYLTPLLGGLLADLWLGKYRTIMPLSLLYCVGHVILAVDQTRLGLFLGLACVAVGAGGIKPCVASHVGDQFSKGNAHLVTRVYSWFYFSINFGSFFASLLTPYLMDKWGPHWAFGIPGLLMFLATWWFWLGRNQYAHIPPQRREFLHELKQPEVRSSIKGLLMIYLFVAMFWGLFDQTASTWVAQADHLDRHLFGIEWKSAQLQALNPILILIYIPLFSLVIYPLIGRVIRLTPLRKISAGFFVAGLSFVVPAYIEAWIANGETPSAWWQALAYAILTAAEVMVSMTAVEFSYTQAPLRLKSFIMGLYYVSVFVGNAFTALVNASIERAGMASTLTGAAYYWFFVKCMTVTAVLFVFVAMFYKGRTYLQDDQSHGKAV